MVGKNFAVFGTAGIFFCQLLVFGILVEFSTFYIRYSVVSILYSVLKKTKKKRQTPSSFAFKGLQNALKGL